MKGARVSVHAALIIPGRGTSGCYPAPARGQQAGGKGTAPPRGAAGARGGRTPRCRPPQAAPVRVRRTARAGRGRRHRRRARARRAGRRQRRRARRPEVRQRRLGERQAARAEDRRHEGRRRGRRLQAREPRRSRAPRTRPRTSRPRTTRRTRRPRATTTRTGTRTGSTRRATRRGSACSSTRSSTAASRSSTRRAPRTATWPSSRPSWARRTATTCCSSRTRPGMDAAVAATAWGHSLTCAEIERQDVRRAADLPHDLHRQGPRVGPLGRAARSTRAARARPAARSSLRLSGPRGGSTSSRPAVSPFSSSGWRTVVRPRASAAGMSSKPTIERSGRPASAAAAMRAERHLIGRAQHRGDPGIAGEQLAQARHALPRGR